MTVLYGGLITWLVTLIIVESFIFRPLRDWLAGMAQRGFNYQTNRPVRRYRRRSWVYNKAAYLVRCHLCMGVWVGWIVAAFIPGPLPLVLTGLLYKAVAHCILEVTGLLRRTNV